MKASDLRQTFNAIFHQRDEGAQINMLLNTVGDIIIYLEEGEKRTTQLRGIPQGTDWKANRYDTDSECVLHVWRDGESFDIRTEKRGDE